MQTKEKTNLFKAGVFMSLMILVLMIFIIMMGEEGHWLSEKTSLKALVPSAQNLKQGAAVQLKGINVGTVKNIQINDTDNVLLELSLDSSHLHWITRGSSVKIDSQGLVGDKMAVIEINPKSSEKFDPQSDFLKPHQSLLMPGLSDQGGKIADKMNRALIKFEILLDQLTKDENIYVTLNNLNKASVGLDRLISSFEKEDVAKKMASSLEGIDSIVNRAQTGPGTIHSLLYEDELYLQINKIVGGASRSNILKYFINKSLEDSDRKRSSEKN